MPTLTGLIVVAALIAISVRWGVNLGSDFVIKGRGTGPVVVKGRIPAGKMAAIREFFRRDLPDLGSFTVRGSFGPGRSLRLRCSGGLGRGQQQRVRNFLVDLLR